MLIQVMKIINHIKNQTPIHLKNSTLELLKKNQKNMKKIRVILRNKFQIIKYQPFIEMKKAKKLITDIKHLASDCKEDAYKQLFMMSKTKSNLK